MLEKYKNVCLRFSKQENDIKKFGRFRKRVKIWKTIIYTLKVVK